MRCAPPPQPLVLGTHTVRKQAIGPPCGPIARRVPRRYRRTPRDLPVGEYAVPLLLYPGRFFCDCLDCPRRPFAERRAAFLPVQVQPTTRVTQALPALGCALGGEAGARPGQHLFGTRHHTPAARPASVPVASATARHHARRGTPPLDPLFTHRDRPARPAPRRPVGALPGSAATESSRCCTACHCAAAPGAAQSARMGRRRAFPHALRQAHPRIRAPPCATSSNGGRRAVGTVRTRARNASARTDR